MSTKTVTKAKSKPAPQPSALHRWAELMSMAADFRAAIEAAERDEVLCRCAARSAAADLESLENELMMALPRKG